MFFLPLLISSQEYGLANTTRTNWKCPDMPPQFISDVFHAIRFRDLYSVRYIVCHNPEVLKSKGDSEMDPLQVAIRAGMFGFARDFVDDYPDYIDFNYQNNKGNTGLHYAYHAKNDFIACPLLEHGASKTIKNKDGLTPVDVGKGWNPTC